jgi:hypothetical protein
VEMDVLSSSKFISLVDYFCQLIELANFVFSINVWIFKFFYVTLFEKTSNCMPGTFC